MPLPVQALYMQAPVEPMQIDLAEENEAPEAEEAYLVENATLDLDAYAAAFTNMAKLMRLLYVAEHCEPLRVEALRMALAHITSCTYNTTQYQSVHRKLIDATLSLAGGTVPGAAAVQTVPILDSQWLETTSKRAAQKLEKLDNDLKNYKHNSIKESIRRGHDDLGDHYLECGDLSNALKCYSRARDYCTSPRHVVNMCLNVIKVSIYLQNWSHLLNYVAKAEPLIELSEPATASGGTAVKDTTASILQTKLKCVTGLAELATKKYKSAAKSFLQASFDHCDMPEILSPNNVATYGTLCALATYSRKELQKNVLSSSSFKLFLELEPQLREVLQTFYDSKYAVCLKTLDDIRDNLLLDVYLGPHLKSLYSQIRKRALCQYFSPYLSADMRKMASAFNTTVSSLEDEVMQLILEGQISARIDSHNKVLFAKDTDSRTHTFEKGFNVGREYQKNTQALVLRAAIHRIGLQVKTAPRDGQSAEVAASASSLVRN